VRWWAIGGLAVAAAVLLSRRRRETSWSADVYARIAAARPNVDWQLIGCWAIDVADLDATQASDAAWWAYQWSAPADRQVLDTMTDAQITEALTSVQFLDVIQESLAGVSLPDDGARSLAERVRAGYAGPAVAAWTLAALAKSGALPPGEGSVEFDCPEIIQISGGPNEW